MQALNIELFQALAAGYAPHPLLLWLASGLAENASWLCVALMGCAAWRRPSQRACIFGALIAAALASVLAHALAEAIAMPRPFAIGLSPSYIPHGARGALPSAHASVMFTIGLVFCLRTALRDVGIGIIAIGVVTGWARIYIGVHFPLDIAAGLLLAIGVAAAYGLLQQWAIGWMRRSAESRLRVSA
ncbi:MAG: phosphatase PAP2 family protein [Variovorax sp.]